MVISANNKRSLHVRSQGRDMVERMAYFAVLYDHVRPTINKAGLVLMLEDESLDAFYLKAGLDKNTVVLAQYLQAVLIHVGSWYKYLLKDAEESTGSKIKTLEQFLGTIPRDLLQSLPPVLETLPFLKDFRWFYQLSRAANLEQLQRHFLVSDIRDVNTRVLFDKSCLPCVKELTQAVMLTELARHTNSPIRRRDYNDAYDWFQAMRDHL